ncbi:MAG: peptidoglycan-binding protein LysM [Paenibacillus sp.]|nr:peptidoglycan-binding protein LysM [Paenibacillus sp.]
MAQHQGGLRFDIYERVHLSEGVAGIKELEDVELVPHIQVLPQGEQALLRGNLLLSGTYVDEQDAANRTLEHLIPVEITLPMNRVQRVEDIAVEIENFDVDLLSTRSLNITGVLSLNGLEVVASPPGEQWGETEGEVVFVHEVPAPAAQRNQEGWGEPAANYQQEQIQADWSTSATVHSDSPQVLTENTLDAQVPRDEQPSSAEAAADDPKALNSEEVEAEPKPDVLVAAVETSLVSSEAESVSEDKKELKIAFSGKKAEVEKPAPSNGLGSLLQGSLTGKFDARGQDKQEAEAQKAAPNAGGKLEWKKLLLSSMNEQQEFRRVRLCIVQKEETLETIAKRYELNPREIALFNRLGENDLTEGQIVYIPK